MHSIGSPTQSMSRRQAEIPRQERIRSRWLEPGVTRSNGVEFSIKIDDATDIPFFSGSDLGPTNTISFEEGYYSFRIIDRFNQVGAEMKVAVMKTSAPPVSVSRIGQTPASRRRTIQSSSVSRRVKPKSAEERIYLRWSTDLFITSHLIEAEGSGMTYSATIPPQPAGTWGAVHDHHLDC